MAVAAGFEPAISQGDLGYTLALQVVSSKGPRTNRGSVQLSYATSTILPPSRMLTAFPALLGQIL